MVNFIQQQQKKVADSAENTAKKIKDLGKDLGCAVKGFKESLNADPKSTTDKSEDKA